MVLIRDGDDLFRCACTAGWKYLCSHFQVSTFETAVAGYAVCLSEERTYIWHLFSSMMMWETEWSRRVAKSYRTVTASLR